MTEDCLNSGGGSTTGVTEEECPPVIVSWEGSVDIQSGDILIVRIMDSILLESPTLTDSVSQNAINVNVSFSKTDGERLVYVINSYKLG